LLSAYNGIVLLTCDKEQSLLFYAGDGRVLVRCQMFRSRVTTKGLLIQILCLFYACYK